MLGHSETKSPNYGRLRVEERRDEQRTVPVGNVSSGRNFGAAAPVFPRACAEVSGESRPSGHECPRHAPVGLVLVAAMLLCGAGTFACQRARIVEAVSTSGRNVRKSL